MNDGAIFFSPCVFLSVPKEVSIEKQFFNPKQVNFSPDEARRGSEKTAFEDCATKKYSPRIVTNFVYSYILFSPAFFASFFSSCATHTIHRDFFAFALFSFSGKIKN